MSHELGSEHTAPTAARVTPARLVRAGLVALPVVLLVVAVLALPRFADPFHLALVTRGMVWAMFGLAVWFPLRSLGLPSFGHAAFFGVAAYAAGLAVTRWQVDNVFVGFALAIVVSCAVAVPIAAIAGRMGSVSFLLVSLAFAEMLHSLALRWREVGGSDGLVGVIRPHAWPLSMGLSRPENYFYFASAVAGVALLVVVLVTRSPFGGVLVGIRESEARMRALGYNPVTYRFAALLVSAGIAGAAGATNAYLNRFVNPEDLGALVSARGLLIAVLAGGAVLGPVLVGIGLTVLEDLLSSYTAHWLALLGAVYVAVAVLATDRARVFALVARLRGAGRHGPPARPVEPVEEVR